MTLKRFTSAQKKEASNLLLEGASVRDVADKFGVHVSTIYDLQKVMGHGHTKKDRASHVVNFRLSEDELTALIAFEVDGKFPNRSAAMRALVRSALGFLELRPDDFAQLEAMNREVKKQGINLNQISHGLNKAAWQGRAKLTKADMAFLQSVKKSYAQLDGTLSRMTREARQKGRDAWKDAR